MAVADRFPSDGQVATIRGNEIARDGMRGLAANKRA